MIVKYDDVMEDSLCDKIDILKLSWDRSINANKHFKLLDRALMNNLILIFKKETS